MNLVAAATMWLAFGRIQLNISGDAGGGASGNAIRLYRAPSTFSATREITSAPGERVVGLVEREQALGLLNRF